MATFLDLVNQCIAESKQALDDLTPATFDNPPRTVLYKRLKGWVAQAYEDLLEERREWFFTSERGVVTIQPRLHLSNMSEDWIPNIGDTLVGQQSGVMMEVTEVFFDNEGHDRDDEVTVGVRYDWSTAPDDLVQWEAVNALSGTSVFEDAARIENRGLYKMEQYIPTIDSVDMNSFTIKLSILDPNFEEAPSTQMFPLRYLDWPQFLRAYDNFYANPAHPRYVSRAPNGDFQFFPYPDGLYDVTFTYEQGTERLQNWDDVPSLLPSKHHSLLVWKALIDLADFNNDRALFSRANKKYMERLGWLMRDNLPEVTFDTSRFYRVS